MRLFIHCGWCDRLVWRKDYCSLWCEQQAKRMLAELNAPVKKDA